MSYNLFIDDDAGKPDMEAFRNPPVGEEGWKVAHSTAEALTIVLEHGIPSFISFDHDLSLLPDGREDTAMDFLKQLEAKFPDAILKINDYRIHSKNPIGVRNIESYMESWRRSMTL